MYSADGGFGVGRISIHALREEGDAERFGHQRNGHRISIHALREEGDPRILPRSQTVKYFYPRPPRGGRQSSTKTIPPPLQFLSTPSARRATRRTVMMDMGIEISIHALREEGDIYIELDGSPKFISIHALREEGDIRVVAAKDRAHNFYPRPPRGGRHNANPTTATPAAISIHALREEGDHPRRDRWYRTAISIHALREEGDQAAFFLRGSSFISIHALREEGDATIFGSFWSASDFYPRPPRGGRPTA